MAHLADIDEVSYMMTSTGAKHIAKVAAVERIEQGDKPVTTFTLINGGSLIVDPIMFTFIPADPVKGKVMEMYHGGKTVPQMTEATGLGEEELGDILEQNMVCQGDADDSYELRCNTLYKDDKGLDVAALDKKLEEFVESRRLLVNYGCCSTGLGFLVFGGADTANCAVGHPE